MHKVLLAGLPDETRSDLMEWCSDIKFDTVSRLDAALTPLECDDYAMLVLDCPAGLEGCLDLLRRLQQPHLRSLKKLLCIPRRLASAGLVRRLTGLGVSGLSYHPLDSEELARQISAAIGSRVPGIRLFALPRKLPALLKPPALGDQFVALRRQWVEQTRDQLRQGAVSAPIRLALGSQAQRLSGELRSFGFVHGAEVARRLEGELGRQDLSEASLARVDPLCEQLLQELGNAPETLVSPESGSPGLLVVCDDPVLSTDLAARSTAAGLRTVVTVAEEDVLAAAASETHDVALVDLGPTLAPERLELMARLARLRPHLPILALIPDSSLQTRVKAASHGAYRLLEQPADASHLLEEIHSLLNGNALPTRILVLDSDPGELASIESSLRPLEASFSSLVDPVRFWELLEARAPNLLLLDHDLPSFSGLELCRAVRTSPRWYDLPIIVLSRWDDAETRRRVFNAGADDCLVKPLQHGELLQRVESRLERSSSRRTRSDVDPLTGLTTRGRAATHLRHYLKLCQRRFTPLSLAVVDLDHFKAINDGHGHPVGDQVLRRVAELFKQAFRDEDVVARWGGEEFVIGMFTMRREHAVKRLEKVLKRLQEESFGSNDCSRFNVSFSAGVAQFPKDGQDLETLYKAADRALYQAKQWGRAQVRGATAAELSNYCDLALLVADTALGEVLLEAAESRGYRTRWFTSTEQVLGTLGGSPPELQARVLLLDTELPSVGWVDVVTGLSETGLLTRCRVILMGRESDEVLASAFEMGIHDHVRKPFNLPVLMHRVDRAIGH